MTKKEFGIAKDGKTAHLYTLENAHGMKAVISDFGAVLQSLWVPMSDGSLRDVVLGFDSLDGYFVNEPGFGAVIGRHANRIGGAEFSLNGKVYHLEKNDGENNLHSNPHGYHRRMWEAEACESPLGEALSLHLLSPAGDQGYPGSLDVTVTYTLTEDNALMIRYYAVTDEDTVVNMTNHSYFNLSGHDAGGAVEQKAQIFAHYYTRADAASIPTGELLPVEDTPWTSGRDEESGMPLTAPMRPQNWGTDMTITGCWMARAESLGKWLSWKTPDAAWPWRYTQICRGSSFTQETFWTGRSQEKAARSTTRGQESVLRPSIFPILSITPTSHPPF